MTETPKTHALQATGLTRCGRNPKWQNVLLDDVEPTCIACRGEKKRKRRAFAEPTPEALEAWNDELMDLITELYAVEDWRNPEKGITQREACIDALRREIARRLREVQHG